MCFCYYLFVMFITSYTIADTNSQVLPISNIQHYHRYLSSTKPKTPDSLQSSTFDNFNIHSGSSSSGSVDAPDNFKLPDINVGLLEPPAANGPIYPFYYNKEEITKQPGIPTVPPGYYNNVPLNIDVQNTNLKNNRIAAEEYAYRPVQSDDKHLYKKHSKKVKQQLKKHNLKKYKSVVDGGGGAEYKKKFYKPKRKVENFIIHSEDDLQRHQQELPSEFSGDILSHSGFHNGDNHHGNERVEFQMHNHNGPESYKFGYDTGKGHGRHFRYEERDHNGKVRGHYGFYDKDGTMRMYKYEADPHTGFHSGPVDHSPDF